MKKTWFCGGVGLLIIVSGFDGCMDNPDDPINIPKDLGIAFTLSRVTDSVNVYCFYPMDIKITLANKDNIRYIDSLHLYKSAVSDSAYKVDLLSLVQRFDYTEVGSHHAFLRIYERRLNGDYRDTVFVVRSSVNYRASPIKVEIGKTGSDVPLRPFGNKHESAYWEWDLTRVGLGVIDAFGDTTVFVDKAVKDTVYLSQTRDGLRTPLVPVLFTVGIEP